MNTDCPDIQQLVRSISTLSAPGPQKFVLRKIKLSPTELSFRSRSKRFFLPCPGSKPMRLVNCVYQLSVQRTTRIFEPIGIPSLYCRKTQETGKKINFSCFLRLVKIYHFHLRIQTFDIICAKFYCVVYMCIEALKEQ